jgi:signal transduction histidine kinase
MLQSDLDLLELEDSSGQVLSSGHFRNEFGQRHPGLVATLERTDSATVLRARSPSGEFDVLARSRTFEIGGRRLALVGGTGLDVARLLPVTDPELRAVFVTGTTAGPSDQARVAEIPFRLLTLDDTTGTAPAAIVVSREIGPMLTLRRSLDRWFLGATAIALLLAGGLALWLSSRVTRPLAELAEKTSRVDLDRLDQSFATGGSDEIGSLSRLLDAMTERLRASAGRIREAERRATTGDLARQINHDVKNGLAPIRHVLRHLGQVARQSPQDLAVIYRERVETLESSVAYLENLSRNYARLSPALDRSESDASALLEELARGADAGVPIDVRAGTSVPPVRADGVVLRRIVENLVANAVDAARESNGRVTISSDVVSRDSRVWVRLAVADTGKGMSQEQLDRAFDDFFTTKEGGTGLGLSVVRRLVADLGGALRVETAPGQGSRFIVELPAGGTR